MSSDTQRLPQDDGIWRVERDEDTERIVDPKGDTRYQGRHSMTAVHFASALRREEQYRAACADALAVLGAEPASSPALTALRERLRAVLKAGPEFWQKINIPPAGSEERAPA